MNPTLPETSRHRELVERIVRALGVLLPDETLEPRSLHKAMRYSALSGGKYLRPLLVYASNQALGGDLAKADAPAAAVEMIHAYSLIHDDLPAMDDDDLRRGRPTCHIAFDEATAILAGDALQALAFEVLAHDAHLRADPGLALKMISTLSRACGSAGMAGGQALDLAATGRLADIDAMRRIHVHKTGALITASVLLGAMSAGRIQVGVLADLELFGAQIGLAFQIQDDILDIEGESESMGKVTGADQALGKSTYPAVLGMAAAKAEARTLLQKALQILARLGLDKSMLAALAHTMVDRTS